MKKKGWKDIPDAGVITEPGNAREYNTGGWRSKRPVMEDEKCVNCLICWAFCPDSSIIVEDGKIKGIDLSHCKGCGICAKECPKKAISMKPEGEFENNE